MVSLLYKTEVFEGPIDLLLSLISRHKLDILDIPISSLLEQYMKQIELMKHEDLDIKSEFLDMATRLLYIKSLSLLPKKEKEEEILKEELTGQLLEYQLCKEIATELGEMQNFGQYIREQEKIKFDMTYTKIHNSTELMKYYLLATERGKRFLPAPREKFAGILSQKIISVSSQIFSLLKHLVKKGDTDFDDLFSQKKDRSERVATFLAILELVKSNRLNVIEYKGNVKIHLISEEKDDIKAKSRHI